MKTKLLRKVRKRHPIYKYTRIDKRSSLYDFTRLQPTEENPVYIVFNNKGIFFYYSSNINEVKDRLLKHIIAEYKNKFPRNRCKFEKI